MEKKILLIVVFILFTGCKEVENKTDLKIIENYKIYNVSDTTSIFKCNDLDIKNAFGKLNIFIKKPNLLIIKCTYNRGYGGEIVYVEINDKLKILNVTFDYVDDTVGGDKEIYTVTNSKIILNKNPFTENLTDVKGEISIKGQVKIKPTGMFEFSRNEKFSFFGYFICE